MIITIDGPVATGKSSVARKLANAMGFIFFDTGAMYRAVAYGFLKHHIDIKDSQKVEEYLKNFDYDIKVIHREKRYYLENEDITDKIRTNEVTDFVSTVSALKPVREKLVAIQREFASGVNAVFEGRDMGTVVFPNASLKIFLTGRDEVRAKRRFEEMQTKFPEEAKSLTLEKCLEDLIKRDQYDSTRENSPLRQADDAFVIDTSDISVEEVVLKILECKDNRKKK